MEKSDYIVTFLNWKSLQNVSSLFNSSYDKSQNWRDVSSQERLGEKLIIVVIDIIISRSREKAFSL